MQKKTENLTTEEAWAAMVRGECVKAMFFVHRIKGYDLQYWNDQENDQEWKPTSYLGVGPYSIVPDPSKPEEPELGEYEKDRMKVVEAPLYPTLEDERAALICFIEKHFQRKL